MPLLPARPAKPDARFSFSPFTLATTMKRFLLSSSLARGGASNYAVLFANIAIGFLLTPFVVNRVGAVGYGVWTFILSVMGCYGLINLGVGSAVIQHVAVSVGRGDREGIHRAAGTAGAFFLITGMLVAGSSVFLASPLARVFVVPPDRVADFRFLIVIMGGAAAVNFIDECLLSLLKAHEKFSQANVAALTKTLVRAASLVGFLQAGHGLRGIGMAAMAGNLAGWAISALMVRRYTSVVMAPRGLSLSLLWALLRFGGVTAVIMAADHIRLSLDSLVIGRWLGMAQVGVYGVAFLLVRYVISLATAAMNVLNPRFAILHGGGDTDAMRRLFSRATLLSSFLAFGCGMGLWVFGAAFIDLWVGSPFEESATVLNALAFPFAVALSQVPGIHLMYATKTHHVYALATVLEAAANLALSIVLVRRFGILGVAIGTAVPLLLVKVFVQPVYVSRIVGLSLWQYARLLLPSALLSLLLCAVAFLSGLTKARFESWIALGGTMLACALCYATLSFAGLARGRRKALLGVLIAR